MSLWLKPQAEKKNFLILSPLEKLCDFPARLLARLRRSSGRRSGGVSCLPAPKN
jgi:hypothetical protein